MVTDAGWDVAVVIVDAAGSPGTVTRRADPRLVR